MDVAPGATTRFDPAMPVYVAGHTGLAGSALVRALRRRGARRLIVASHAELDLEDPAATRVFLRRHRPALVFLAAARVGGIVANDSAPHDFLMRNLAIEMSVLEAARTTGVARLVFLGSSCIYPRECPQPMREDHLLGGPLEPTNRAYAIAKIAGIEMCRAANRQHGCGFLAAMPTNLYGPGDNYHPEHSHVLPALLRKIDTARAAGAPQVTLWGSGTPLREFLHADDLAKGLLFLAGLDEPAWRALLDAPCGPLINIGSGEELSIAALARRIARVLDYRGEFVFDPSRPDGTPRKRLDTSRLATLGWRPRISLDEGILDAWHDLRARGLGAARPDALGQGTRHEHAV